MEGWGLEIPSGTGANTVENDQDYVIEGLNKRINELERMLQVIFFYTAYKTTYLPFDCPEFHF